MVNQCRFSFIFRLFTLARYYIVICRNVMFVCETEKWNWIGNPFELVIRTQHQNQKKQKFFRTFAGKEKKKEKNVAHIHKRNAHCFRQIHMHAAQFASVGLCGNILSRPNRKLNERPTSIIVYYWYNVHLNNCCTVYSEHGCKITTISWNEQNDRSKVIHSRT